MTSNKSLKLEIRCSNNEIHSDQVPPWDQQQQQQHQTHRLLAISSLVMPAGGSTPSPGMRSSTSALWHPAHDVTAGGSKASAMAGYLTQVVSGVSARLVLETKTNGQKHERNSFQRTDIFIPFFGDEIRVDLSRTGTNGTRESCRTSAHHMHSSTY